MAPSKGAPRRTIRFEDDLWNAFGDAVERNEPPKDRSEVLRDFMRWYVGEKGVRMPRRPNASEPER